MKKKEVKEIEETVVESKTNKDIPEYYVVKIGETLKDVAKKFNLDEKTLEELNGQVIGTNQIKLK